MTLLKKITKNIERQLKSIFNNNIFLHLISKTFFISTISIEQLIKTLFDSTTHFLIFT